MRPMPTLRPAARPDDLLTSARRAASTRLGQAWQAVHLGALVMAEALSPGSYRGADRAALAHQVWRGTAPALPAFTVLSALISIVLTRIVAVTAESYGLTQYALEMVVRVLVLELVPLTAALYVTLRCTIPFGAELARLQRQGRLDALRRRGIDPVRRELLPRVAAGVFAVPLLALVSCGLALVIAYLMLYGFTPWAFDGYTRRVGQIFSPDVTLLFVLKTLLLSLAVGLVPTVSGLADALHAPRRDGGEIRGLVWVFAVIVLVEIAALVGNYA